MMINTNTLNKNDFNFLKIRLNNYINDLESLLDNCTESEKNKFEHILKSLLSELNQASKKYDNQEEILTENQDYLQYNIEINWLCNQCDYWLNYYFKRHNKNLQYDLNNNIVPSHQMTEFVKTLLIFKIITFISYIKKRKCNNKLKLKEAYFLFLFGFYKLYASLVYWCNNVHQLLKFNKTIK